GRTRSGSRWWGAGARGSATSSASTSRRGRTTRCSSTTGSGSWSIRAAPSTSSAPRSTSCRASTAAASSSRTRRPRTPAAAARRSRSEPAFSRMPAGSPPSRLARRPEGWLPGMRIAYVIPAFPPAPSQPFVVNEMIEVQEAGHEVFIVPLYRGATALRHGTFARTVAGVPFSFTAHAYDIYAGAPRFRNDTLGWKLRRAAQVFAVSDFAAQRLRAQLPPAARGRVHTAYVGIPLELFRPEPPLPSGDGLALLCVARLAETKGLATLVDACALLRDRRVRFRLRLYGDGPLRQALAAHIAARGLGAEVVLAGPVPQEEVARQMRACHAVVMPCRQDPTG